MSKEMSDFIFTWVMAIPAICAWICYGGAWFGGAHISEPPIVWAYIGAIVGITPAFCVGLFGLSLWVASILTGRAR